MSTAPGLIQIFLVFLKMGATSFGGNVALVAAIRREICEKRKWMHDEEVLDLMAVGNLLPGPLATNVCAACGYRLSGYTGAAVALAGVLFPSFVLIILLSWLYLIYGKMEIVSGVMNGILAGVTAVIAATAFELGKKNVRHPAQFVLLLISGAAVFFLKSFWVTLGVILISGITGYLLWSKNEKTGNAPKVNFIKPLVVPAASLVVLLLIWIGTYGIDIIGEIRSLFFTFSSMSVTLFGGGYVFVPAIEKVVVHHMHWVTSREFADAIAMGQITPGPIMISSVFIGWKVAGFWGALVAATGMFVPPAILMIGAQQLVKNLKGNAVADAVFKGVRPAVIGMIAVSAWIILSSAPVTFYSAGIFALMVGMIIWKKTDSAIIVIASGILGYLISLL